MLMKALYNFGKSPSAEPSLKRNIVPDAKNTEKFVIFPWKPQLKPFCGSHHLFISAKRIWGSTAFAKRIFINFEIVMSREPFLNTIQHFGCQQ
jgi:hypothetical protein